MIQIGNGNWAVKEDNLLGFRYDETEGVYFPREMTFGRACDATRVNPDGLIERVPYNLIQQSQTFENWTVGSVTVSANSTTAPDGTLSADTLVEVAATAQHQLISATASFASGVGYSFSIYAKASTSYVLQLTHNNAFSSNLYANFDLQNGVVGTYGAGTVATIQDAGNGWYRCTMYGVATATASGSFLAVLVDDNTSASRRPSYAGDGTSSVYIWGAQLVEGTTAKPYFPTTNRQDIARIDYSSETGALLLEPQRTNLVTYSEQFDNGAWVKVATTLTANATTSPDGATNADAVLETTATGVHYTRQDSIPTTASTAYTTSVYVKANGRSYFAILDPNASGGSKGRYFSIPSDGTGSVLGTLDGTPTNSTISYFGNGWYRCSITTTAGGASMSPRIYISDTGSNISYAGDVTKGLFVYGFQCESGSYATSYITTTSASVTRLADSCYKTGVADWIGQTEGTLFYDFIYKTTDQTRVSISDGSSTNWIFIGIPDSNTHSRVYIRTNGTVQVDTSSNLLGIFTSGQRYKIALAYKSGDWAIAVNGTIKTSGSQTFSPSAAFNTIVLTGNSSAASSQLGLNQLNHATIYKTRLSNSELAALTTI